MWLYQLQQMLSNMKSNAKNEIILNLFTQEVIIYVTFSTWFTLIEQNDCKLECCFVGVVLVFVVVFFRVMMDFQDLLAPKESE